MSTALEMRRRLLPAPDLVELQPDDPELQLMQQMLQRRHESDRRRRDLQVRTILFLVASVASFGGFLTGVLWLLTRWEVR